MIIVRPGAVNTPFWKKVPFKMPANALAPQRVAERVTAAVAEGYQGTLDL